MPKVRQLTSLLIISLILSSNFAIAQDPISTERPSQSNSGYVLLPGRLNVETGFQYQQTTDGVDDLLINTTLLRYGVNEFFEIRGSFNYQQTSVEVEGANESGTGFSPFTLGLKVKLLEEQGWVPQLAMVSQITLTGGQSPFAADNVVPNLRLSAQWSVGEKGAVLYNQGWEWSEGSDRVTHAFTLLYAHALTGELTWFLETYGFLAKGLSDHRADTGFAYLINDKLQVDAYGGLGLNDEAPDWFAAFGVSFALFN